MSTANQNIDIIRPIISQHSKAQEIKGMLSSTMSGKGGYIFTSIKIFNL